MDAERRALRPARKAIPIRVKRAVVDVQDGLCKCGCGQAVSEYPRRSTHFDHEPALRLRAVNEAGTDYLPPQHDPDYIDARCPTSHNVKTRGRGATTAGTDTGKIKKRRKLERREAGVVKRKRKWPKRKMQSRNNFRNNFRPKKRRRSTFP